MQEENFLVKIFSLSKKMADKIAIDNISLNLFANKKIAIAGETGSGKSTLLKLIAGLEQADSGDLYFNNEKIKGPNEQLIPGHKKIAYLSQHFELRNNYHIWEILSYANELTQNEADELYQLCRIDHLLNRWTDELSGGEKQRVALARLLTTSPSLLLLDEPYSNLDAHHKKIISEIIHDISSRLNITCIMVSHDAPDILSWADTLIIMKDGKLIQQGNPDEIYHHPINEYCAGLLGDYSLINIESKLAKYLLTDSIPEQKQLLIRPNYFSINTNQKISLSALVIKINFRGNYTLLTTEAEGEQLQLISFADDIKKGDEIKISIARENRWYI